MEAFLNTIKTDQLNNFQHNLNVNPLLLDWRSNDLNIYQIACFFGSIKIVKFLENEGYSFLGDEIDDDVSFTFIFP